MFEYAVEIREGSYLKILQKFGLMKTVMPAKAEIECRRHFLPNPLQSSWCDSRR